MTTSTDIPTWQKCGLYVIAASIVSTLYVLIDAAPALRATLGWFWLIPVAAMFGWGLREEVLAHKVGSLGARAMRGQAILAGVFFACALGHQLGATRFPSISPRNAWIVCLVIAALLAVYGEFVVKPQLKKPA